MEVVQMESSRDQRYCDARLEVDFHSHMVWLDRMPVRLTHLEFELLSRLVAHAGEIVSRNALMLDVWGFGPEVHSRTMDVHLRRLRVKMGSYGRQHIETVFGLGYRLQPCKAGPPLVHAVSA
ncbi:MAG TPA: winged helix-turn-helix domain-containing protein [Bryobacteraceae bacterium]|nr:winged helix-turn-helix domain-containing protein [Bryobacteraceae bacterium]